MTATPNLKAIFGSLKRSTDQQRECSKCGKMHNRMRDHSTGELASYCFECQAAYTRARRPKYQDMSPEQKLKANCRAYAKVYLRRGKLIRQPCKLCSEPNTEMHHEDYSKPLEVTWLCKLCHVRYHWLKGDLDGHTGEDLAHT